MTKKRKQSGEVGPRVRLSGETRKALESAQAVTGLPAEVFVKTAMAALQNDPDYLALAEAHKRLEVAKAEFADLSAKFTSRTGIPISAGV